LYQALNKHCGEVEILGHPDFSLTLFFGKVKSFLAQKILGKRFAYKHSKVLAKRYASYFNQKLSGKQFDVIFAPAASAEIAYLRTSIPIISLSDTTFLNMVNYYLTFTNLTKGSFKQGTEIERRALTNSSAIIYPSSWAASSAKRDYQIVPSKLNIIPLGANINDIPPAEDVINKQISSSCHLLFFGVDWHRKGGEVAFDAMVELNKKGIDTTLLVCGCIPPQNFSHEKLSVIPFIDKNDPAQEKKLYTIFMNTTFLILPSKAECFGIVFCEASAFGIPSITSDTGGIEGAVKTGVNGYRLPVNAGGSDYAQKIAEIFTDKTAYQNLKKSSRALFDNSLNWDAWGQKTKEVFDRVLSLVN